MKTYILRMALTITLLAVAFLFQSSITLNQGKNKPLATYRIGSAKATVWQNDGKYGPWKDFEIEKIYLKENKWLSTNSFNQTELLELRAVIDIALEKEIASIQNSNQDSN